MPGFARQPAATRYLEKESRNRFMRKNNRSATPGLSRTALLCTACPMRDAAAKSNLFTAKFASASLSQSFKFSDRKWAPLLHGYPRRNEQNSYFKL